MESLPIIVNLSSHNFSTLETSANISLDNVCTEYAQYRPEPVQRSSNDFQFCTSLGESDNYCSKLNRSNPECQDPCMYNNRFRLIGTLVQGLIFIIGKLREFSSSTFSSFSSLFHTHTFVG